MKLFKQLIKPALGLLIIFILVNKGGLEFHLLFTALKQYPQYLIFGFIFYIALIFIAGCRWFLLIRCVGIKVTFSTIFSLHMIGVFFVTLIPGGTGGDVVKGYYIYRDTLDKKGMALSSVVMDRVVGLYALMTWGILGILMNYKIAFTHPLLSWNSWFYLTIFIIATIMVGTFFSPLAPTIMNHNRIGALPGNRIIRGLFEAFQVYRKFPETLLKAYLMTLVLHGCLLMVFYFSALSLQVNFSIMQHSFVVPLLTMVNGIPLSPAGIGVGEAAAETLYRLLGNDMGGEISMIFHIFVVISAFLGTPFYLFYKKKK